MNCPMRSFVFCILTQTAITLSPKINDSNLVSNHLLSPCSKAGCKGWGYWGGGPWHPSVGCIQSTEKNCLFFTKVLCQLSEEVKLYVRNKIYKRVGIYLVISPFLKMMHMLKK